MSKIDVIPSPSMRAVVRRVLVLVRGLFRRAVVPVLTATMTPVVARHLLLVAISGILLTVVVWLMVIAVVVQPLVGSLGPVVLSRRVALVAQAVLAVPRAVVVVTLVQMVLLRATQGLSRQVAVVRLTLPLAVDVLLAVSPVQPLLGGPTVGGGAVPRRPRVPLPPLLLALKVLLGEADVERAAAAAIRVTVGGRGCQVLLRVPPRVPGRHGPRLVLVLGRVP